MDEPSYKMSHDASFMFLAVSLPPNLCPSLSPSIPPSFLLSLAVSRKEEEGIIIVFEIYGSTTLVSKPHRGSWIRGQSKSKGFGNSCTLYIIYDESMDKKNKTKPQHT